MFIRFDVIHERDRRTDEQTDRQTLRDSIDRACIASRGNKDYLFTSDLLCYDYRGGGDLVGIS